jgi:methylmalonyl-CoA mutase C-terminal domain/subunit
VVKLMRENRMDDVILIVGGVFPKEEIARLKETGVDEVFMGSMVGPVVDYIRKNVRGGRI